MALKVAEQKAKTPPKVSYPYIGEGLHSKDLILFTSHSHGIRLTNKTGNKALLPVLAEIGVYEECLYPPYDGEVVISNT